MCIYKNKTYIILQFVPRVFSCFLLLARGVYFLGLFYVLNIKENFQKIIVVSGTAGNHWEKV